MNKKRIFKKTLFVLGVVVILIVGSLIVLYFYMNAKPLVNEEKYPHYIGYINQEEALLNKAYTLCNKDTIYKVHHGAPKEAFQGSKKRFRETILSAYKNKEYSDSGYLNFRFLVSCEGNAGWFEIIEMNLDLEETTLNDDMVNQLLTHTADPKHWAIYTNDNIPRDYYMYISYRIENGEITEILP
jgi:hypothetical protein